MDTTEMGEPVGMVGSGSGARIVQAHQASSSQPDFTSSLAYHSPHHQYIYSTGGAADFAMPPQFSQEFPPYSTPDVSWNVATPSAQHLHGQNFVSQDGLPQFSSQYSPQVQIPQQQHQFNSYSSAAQPTTIAPSQLGGSSFSTQTTTVSPPELWAELGEGSSQVKQLQPNTRTRQKSDVANTRPTNTASAASSPNPIKVKGCPWITVLTGGIDPQMIRAFSYSLKLCPPSANILTEALQSVNLVNEPLPAAPPPKKTKLTAAKTQPPPPPPPPKSVPKAPPKPKIPDDPAERIKHLVRDALTCDEDIEDIREASKKLWDIMLEVPLEQPKLVEVVVWSILKFGDDVILQHLGSSILFTVRLRYWMTTEWNRDRASPTVLMLLRVSFRGLMNRTPYNYETSFSRLCSC